MIKKSEKDLISNAVVDPAFRQRLLVDPEGVIASDGYDVSAETLAQIKRTVAMSPTAVDAAIESATRDGGISA